MNVIYGIGKVKKAFKNAVLTIGIFDGLHIGHQKLIEAAALMETQPMSLQLRYLQTLNQIAAENNSTIAFPVPLDLFKPFLKLAEKA